MKKDSRNKSKAKLFLSHYLCRRRFLFRVTRGKRNGEEDQKNFTVLRGALVVAVAAELRALRSILCFFRAAGRGRGTAELQRGHLGLDSDMSTYRRQLGQPAATIFAAPPPSSPGGELVESPSQSSVGRRLAEEVVVDDDAGDVDPVEGSGRCSFWRDSRSARSRADFTFSRVQTLWYSAGGGASVCSFRSRAEEIRSTTLGVVVVVIAVVGGGGGGRLRSCKLLFGRRCNSIGELGSKNYAHEQARSCREYRRWGKITRNSGSLSRSSRSRWRSFLDPAAVTTPPPFSLSYRARSLTRELTSAAMGDRSPVEELGEVPKKRRRGERKQERGAVTRHLAPDDRYLSNGSEFVH